MGTKYDLFQSKLILLLLAVLVPTGLFALEPPSNVDWISGSESSVTFSWANSTPDARVEFQFKRAENDWGALGTTRPGVESLRWSPILSGDQFRLRTVLVDADQRVTEGSSYTEASVISTRSDLSVSDRECVIDSPGEFLLPLNLQGFVFAEVEVTGVPEGVALVDSPPRIAGPIDSGMYSVTISAATGKHRRTTNLELIITEAPEVVSPVGNLSAMPAAPDAVIDLNNVFADPDTETVVRIDTILGKIDLALYDQVSPLTVTSFLSYVDRGALDGTFVHNSVAESFSILQAGQYIPLEGGKLQQVAIDASASPADFDASSSNVCGTIAMLKPTGDRATNQWLFNFSDNSVALDRFYGAFGRVMGEGMSVVNAISELPVTSDNAATVVSCEGTPPNETCTENLLAFDDWPLLRIRDEGLDTDDLVTISNISRISPLSFSLISNTAPAVAAVTLSPSGELTIDYLAPGQTKVEVSAIDRDGVSTTYSFSISVGETFEAWAVGAGLTGDDAALSANPDNDQFNNLSEYAFGGNPSKQDPSTTDVTVDGKPSVGDQPAITFSYRQNAGDIDYAVQLSRALDGGWRDIWTSSQGLDDPQVFSTEDLGGGMKRITITATDALLPAFLRVHVSIR